MDKKYYFNNTSDIYKPKSTDLFIRKIIQYQIKVSQKYNENNVIIPPPKTKVVTFD